MSQRKRFFEAFQTFEHQGIKPRYVTKVLMRQALTIPSLGAHLLDQYRYLYLKEKSPK